METNEKAFMQRSQNILHLYSIR